MYYFLCRNLVEEAKDLF